VGLLHRNIEVAPWVFWVSGSVFRLLVIATGCNATDELFKTAHGAAMKICDNERLALQSRISKKGAHGEETSTLNA
jgi:hypothetical protein